MEKKFALLHHARHILIKKIYFIFPALGNILLKPSSSSLSNVLFPSVQQETLGEKEEFLYTSLFDIYFFSEIKK